MNVRRARLAGFIVVIWLAGAAGCEDPKMPRIPPDDEEEEEGDGEQLGCDVRPAPLFYLV